MTLIERLHALGLRLEAEGIYTDQNICEEAAKEIERLQKLVHEDGLEMNRLRAIANAAVNL